MNKGIIIALIVGLVVGITAWLSSRPAEVSQPTNNTLSNTIQSPKSSTVDGNVELDGLKENKNKAATAVDTGLVDDEIDEFDEEIKPANQVYASAAEALEAVKIAAERYDDIVLEQFAGLTNCAWCPEFYAGINELMQAESSSSDLKSYTAEILALSGSTENVEALFTAVEKNAGKEDANIYAEAIELSYGDDKLVNFLTEKSISENALIKEAAIAALTNHGTPSAFEALYQATIKANDPDGFYSQGLGIGEMILDEAAIPLATEAARKNDQYSGLAVKALLNNGLEGLKIVQSVIADLDEASVEKLLENAVDHVSYEDEVKAIASSYVATAKTNAEKRFWEEVIEEIALSEEEELEYDDDEDDDYEEEDDMDK